MITRSSIYDSRLESYKPFFDGEWASTLLDLTEGTKLQSSFVDLAHNWRSLSNARHLPRFMVMGFDLSLEKELQTIEPLDAYKIRMFCEKLVESLDKRGATIRPMLKKQIQQCLNDLDQKACEALRTAREHITDRETSHWIGLQEQVDFTTSLWALERICYCAIYFNYEAFLTACIRIKVGNPTIKISRDDDFKQALNDIFGQAIQIKCWSDQPIVIARLTRHAIVHNCGRMTTKLDKQPHTFPIIKDEIQIQAPHTTELFNDLKVRVTLLCEAAIKMAEFK